MSVAWPHVKAMVAAVVPNLPGVSGWIVYSGPPATDAVPAQYVTVGFVTDDSGGSYTQILDGDGTVTTEMGEVRSQLVAQSGGADPSIAEATAFALADALDTYVRANRRLGGVLSGDGTSEAAVEVHSVSNTNGTATALVYVLRYTTTT